MDVVGSRQDGADLAGVIRSNWCTGLAFWELDDERGRLSSWMTLLKLLELMLTEDQNDIERVLSGDDDDDDAAPGKDDANELEEEGFTTSEAKVTELYVSMNQPRSSAKTLGSRIRTPGRFVS